VTCKAYPESVKCAGTCGRNIFTCWAWIVDGKHYCGDCALDELDRKDAVKKTEKNLYTDRREG